MAKTTNYDLEKPTIGSVGWGEEVNENFDTIDTQLKVNADADALKVPLTRTVNSKALSSDVVLTTADVADSADKRYCTDAQKVVIGNTSGTNSGNETVTTIKTALGITTLSGSNTGDETSATVQTKLGDGTVNPTNLLSNGDFESWSAGNTSAPDGWTISGASATIEKTTATKLIGTASAKLTRAGTNCLIGQTVHKEKGINYFRGRSVTFGCWVVSGTEGVARIGISDGVGTTYSSWNSGANFQFLTVTRTIDASATTVQLSGFINTSDVAAYFDGAMCVEGAANFAFSPKPAEEGVWADYSAVSTIVGWASFTTKKVSTKRIGKLVFVWFDIEGTSNTTGESTISLPYAINSTLGSAKFVAQMADNGGAAEWIPAYVQSSGIVVTGSYTNSGVRWARGQCFYEMA
jgi:hypothetical protein